MSRHVIVMKLPITHCTIPESLLNHLDSFCGGMFKLHTKFDADSLPYSVILNVIAAQYTCSLMASTTHTDLYSEAVIVHT